MSTAFTFWHLEEDVELLGAYDVMHELRPMLTSADAFVAQIHRQQTQGYRLLAARDGQDIVGLAGYRRQENLLYGRFVYVDDLVVTGGMQRSGLGAQLLDSVRHMARQAACRHFVLDTGLHMALAQRFYYRQGLLAKGMHFVEALQPDTF
jgi:GNAT superfamily N-acetyltransferase